MQQSADANPQITVALHGVRLMLSSEREDFLAFARGYLAPLASEDGGTPQVRVEVAWDARGLDGEGDGASAGMEQLGRRLWAGPERLRFAEIWQFPGLSVDVAWQGDTLMVNAVFVWPSRRAKWFAALLPGPRAQLFVGLIYYLVYFPWMWWLERECGWTLLHAAALSVPGGLGAFAPQEGVVLSGLPGSGKSTTTLAFLSRSEWQVVSDNLLFTDGQQVFACVEPIHVDDRARALAGGEEDLKGRLRPTRRRFSHGRQDYEVTPAARCPFTTPRVVGFIHVGRQTAVRRLDAEEGVRRLLANDYLAKEWQAYQESAAAMHQVWPAIGDQERRRASLSALARSSPCYEVTIARGENVSRAVSGVLQAIEADL